MKKLALLVMAAMLSTAAFAQNNNKTKMANRRAANPEMTIEARVAHMQNQLLLDDKQGKKFAEIYTDYLTAQQKLRGERKQEVDRRGKDAKPLSDSEMVKQQKQRIENQKKMAELNETYYNKLSSVLNARQLEKVFFSHKQGARFDGKKGMRDNNGRVRPMNNRKEGQRPIAVCPEQGEPATATK
ncbi:MAG: Spy/CpxP family protein refolding chaperone [Muribaculaceae bacterium]